MSALPPFAQAPPDQRIRVMLVDDSAVIRGFVMRILESDPRIDVVATCSNGESAVHQIARREVDIVILDIEMPVMDGLTALPKLLAAAPGVQIIMASSLTLRNAEISLHALGLGAADYIPKPSAKALGGSADFRRELLDKIAVLGARRRRQRNGRTERASGFAVSAAAVIRPETVALRSAGGLRPDLIAIGSSTGGPQALMAVLGALPPSVDAPIVIAQHMPATFTAILAQHIARSSGRPCTEARDQEPLRPGTILLAPGDNHLEIARGSAGLMARLTKSAPENFCRPSVNPLLRSASRAVGANLAVVILTGMGNDGLDGAREAVAAGAALIAQDEASSVVWGMPGAVAKAGLCSAVLPLSEIASHLSQNFSGRRP